MKPVFHPFSRFYGEALVDRTIVFKGCLDIYADKERIEGRILHYRGVSGYRSDIFGGLPDTLQGFHKVIALEMGLLIDQRILQIQNPMHLHSLKTQLKEILKDLQKIPITKELQKIYASSVIDVLTATQPDMVEIFKMCHF